MPRRRAGINGIGLPAVRTDAAQPWPGGRCPGTQPVTESTSHVIQNMESASVVFHYAFLDGRKTVEFMTSNRQSAEQLTMFCRGSAAYIGFPTVLKTHRPIACAELPKNKQTGTRLDITNLSKESGFAEGCFEVPSLVSPQALMLPTAAVAAHRVEI